MTRERVPCLLSGLVLLTVLLMLVRGVANVIVGGVDDFFRCSEYIREEIASPGGRHIAQVVIIGCGGAAGSVDTAIRLRSAVDDPDREGQTVVRLGASYGLSVFWEGEQHLLIEHSCGAVSVDRLHNRWHDISISYRCVDPQEERPCNACGDWRHP